MPQHRLARPSRHPSPAPRHPTLPSAVRVHGVMRRGLRAVLALLATGALLLPLAPQAREQRPQPVRKASTVAAKPTAASRLRTVHPAPRAKPQTTAVAPQPVAEGPISFYAQRFHGRATANGERLDNEDLTMAHPDLPFGTVVRVTNLQNQRTAVLRVNDRGPFVGRRVADVSRAAAELLGFVQRGVTTARLEVVSVVGTAGAVAGAAAQAAAQVAAGAASATLSGVNQALGALESQVLPAVLPSRPGTASTQPPATTGAATAARPADAPGERLVD